MAHKAGHKTGKKEQVVGVFMDASYAEQAAQALRSAGFKAKMADESAISAFNKSGFKKEIVDIYRNRYNEGNSILVVDDPSNGEEALGIMLQYGAEYINLSDQGSAWGSYAQGQQYDANYYRNLQSDQRQYGYYDQNLGRARNQDEIRVQLREEQLVPVKQAVQTGEVGVQKTVREQQHEVPLNLRHDEVIVERHAVDKPADPREIGEMREESMSVPVYEERADLQRQARVYEEVTISKQPVEEQRTVTGTTRREEIDVTQSGDVAIRGDAAVRTGESWSDMMPTYRSRWEQSNRGASTSWNEVEPAYRYAYQMQSNPRYQGRSYDEVERDLRNEWQGYDDRTPWEKIASNVRQAWNEITT